MPSTRSADFRDCGRESESTLKLAAVLWKTRWFVLSLKIAKSGVPPSAGAMTCG